MPLDGTGTSRPSVVPSPSWPALLAPQHQPLPSLRTAHTCCAPAATATGSGIDGTRTGRGDDVPFPSPSSPAAPSPQHQSPSARVAAQVCCRPTAALVTAVSPATLIGCV